jgi:outer membrane biosynthesis protein TonB
MPELQAPTVTGVYRFFATKRGSVSGMQVVRASLMPGFDSAAAAAIGTAAAFGALVPSTGEDSMRAEVRFSTDSSLGARRIISASLPRMRVVNAVPRRDNPPPVFPDEEKGDSTVTGEVIFRFVVDRDGSPAMETVELVRGTALSFVKTALAILPKQMFAPATIGGCAVSQRVELPFTFAAPHVEHQHTSSRH